MRAAETQRRRKKAEASMSASFALTLPEGMWRPAVLGFSASMFRSMTRFRAFAALRAPRKASATRTRRRQPGRPPVA